MIPNNVWLCCTVASPEARTFHQIRIVIITITTMIQRIRVTVLLITIIIITTIIAMNLRHPQQLFNGKNRAGASI